jgi:hypothetical protein
MSYADLEFIQVLTDQQSTTRAYSRKLEEAEEAISKMKNTAEMANIFSST